VFCSSQWRREIDDSILVIIILHYLQSDGSTARGVREQQTDGAMILGKERKINEEDKRGTAKGRFMMGDG
jgi:hypothetical protein